MTETRGTVVPASRGIRAGVLVGVLVVGAAGCTQGDPPSPPLTSSSTPSAEASPTPLPDLCALLDVEDLAELVPATAGVDEAEQGTDEVGATCTLDNGLPAGQDRVVVVRATTWPTFDVDTLRAALDDRCEDAPAVVEEAADGSATCSGGASDAAEAHALSGQTVVSVTFQNSAGAGVSDAQQAALVRLADEVLAGL